MEAPSRSLRLCSWESPALPLNVGIVSQTDFDSLRVGAAGARRMVLLHGSSLSPSPSPSQSGGVALVLRGDARVAAGDLVAHPWVAQLLGVGDQEEVGAWTVPCAPAVPSPPAVPPIPAVSAVSAKAALPSALTPHVSLRFWGSLSALHWDELPFEHFRRLPAAWSPHWPPAPFPTPQQLSRQCPLLLLGSPLVHTAAVAMRVLDAVMVFRVELPPHLRGAPLSPTSPTTQSPLYTLSPLSPLSPRSPVLGDAHCQYRIDVEDADVAHAMGESRSDEAGGTGEAAETGGAEAFAPCFQQTLWNVLVLCEGIFGSSGGGTGRGSSSGSGSCGGAIPLPRSVLLSAPEGGGKSALLCRLATLCSARYAHSAKQQQIQHNNNQQQHGASWRDTTSRAGGCGEGGGDGGGDRSWSGSGLRVLRLSCSRAGRASDATLRLAEVGAGAGAGLEADAGGAGGTWGALGAEEGAGGGALWSPGQAARFHLRHVLLLLGVEDAGGAGAGALLLLLDDVDLVLAISAEEEDRAGDGEDGGAGVGRVGDALRLLGLHLRALLQALSLLEVGGDSDRDEDRGEGYRNSRGGKEEAGALPRVLVVGASRLSGLTLPRSHQGYPEFEAVLPLSAPSPAERHLLLACLLRGALGAGGGVGGDVGVSRGAGGGLLLLDSPDLLLPDSALPAEAQEQGHRAEGETKGEREVLGRELGREQELLLWRWSGAMAALSGGSLPGDLHGTVRRLLLLHRGEAAARKAQEKARELREVQGTQEAVAGDEEVGVVGGLSQGKGRTQEQVGAGGLLWRSALEAVLSSVPKQLQGLSAGVGGMGVGGGTERLRWGDFAGYEGVLKDLQRRLAPTHVPTHAPHVSGEGVRRLAVRPLAGVVLHGPSGCGKSLLAAVMASELRMNFVPIRCTDLLSRYFGQTEAAVRTLFRRARNAAPALLFFDDFDLLAHRRSDGEVEGSGGLQGRVLSTLLNELDGILGPPSAPTAPPFPSSSLPGAASGFPGFPGMGGGGGWGGGGYGGGLAGVLVVAACREARQLDEALLRPGRLQHHVYLGYPTEADILRILQRHAAPLRCAPDLSLLPAAQALHGLGASCAEAECFVKNAFSHALRELVLRREREQRDGKKRERDRETREGWGEEGEREEEHEIGQQHFDLALRDLFSGREGEEGGEGEGGEGDGGEGEGDEGGEGERGEEEPDLQEQQRGAELGPASVPSPALVPASAPASSPAFAWAGGFSAGV